MFDESLKKRFVNTYKFSNLDIKKAGFVAGNRYLPL